MNNEQAMVTLHYSNNSYFVANQYNTIQTITTFSSGTHVASYY